MLRYVLRTLWRSPGFSGAVILTLALGIGGNAAVFSAVNAILLRDLPYRAPEEIYGVRQNSPLSPFTPLSPRQVSALREEAAEWAEVEALDLLSFNLVTDEGAERIAGSAVTPGMLGMLGVAPQIGRGLSPEEGRTGSNTVALLSHSLWQSRFGGREDVVGEDLELVYSAAFGPRRDLGRRFTVVGVLPEEFLSPIFSADLYVPLALPQEAPAIDNNHLFGFARIPDLPPETAREAMSAIVAALPPRPGLSAAEQPEIGITLRETGRTGGVRPRLATALWVLLGAVGLLLLGACANVANLLLARNTARRREIAVRQALGSGQGRLLGWLLTESLVLSLLGALGGLAVAFGGVRLLHTLQPTFLPRLGWVQVDGRVLLFTLGMALLTTLFFGIGPALRSSRDALMQRQGSGSEGRRFGMGGGLVVVQVALAIVLLVGAGLLMRSFQGLVAVDLGFRTENLLTFQVTLPPGSYSEPERWPPFHRAVRESLEALPGVRSVGLSTGLPLTPVNTNSRVRVPGAEAETEAAGTSYRLLSDGFLETLGAGLEEGRFPRASDLPPEGGRGTVVVVNRTFAERFFPGESALERTLDLPSLNLEGARVVGVVADLCHAGPQRPVDSMVYVPGIRASRMGYALRLEHPGAVDAERVRRAVASVDPAQPIHGLTTYSRAGDVWLGQPHAVSRLMAVFALLALGVSALGLGSVLAFAVRRRRSEIGVRSALGARPGQILGLFLRRGLLLVGAGLACGLAAAPLLGSVLGGLLYGVEATDPHSLTLAALAALAVAAPAIWIPARRALGIEPARVLREE